MCSENPGYEVMSFLKKIVTTSDSYFAEINGMLEATLLRLAELEDINIVSRWIDFPLGCREVENGGEILEPFQYIDLNISNATFPTMENIDNLEKKTKSKNKNVRLSAYIRLLVTYIVCDKCDMKSKTLIEAKRFVSNDFRVLSEIIECYEIKCGNEERKKKAKESFLTQIELQIEKISEEGIAYCVDFQKEIARLLQRLEFYHKKCMDFQWNIEEIKVIIKYLDKWADTIQEISQPICYEWDYYKSWCILETILMEILSSSEPKLKHIYHVQLCSLENKLNKLDIPFLLRQIVYEENIDIFRLLFKACQKGKRDRDEAERISFFYKIES